MRIIGLFLGLAALMFLWGARGSPEEEMVHSKARHLALAAQEIYGMPASRQAKILWNYDDDWHRSGETNCKLWTVTLNHHDVMNNLDIVLRKVLPHEYGHLVHCFQYGSVGYDAHGIQWQLIVKDLGGDPDFR